LVALALWQGSEAIWGCRSRDGVKRVRKQVASGARALIYAALGFSAGFVRTGLGILELTVPSSKRPQVFWGGPRGGRWLWSRG